MRHGLGLIVCVLTVMLVSGLALGATLIIDRPADSASLDPHYELTAPGSWVYGQILETLVTLDHDMNIVPKLATHWEYLSPTHLRFYLREGVLFHDGTEFTAEAVEFTWHRGLYGDPPGRWLAFVGPIVKVEAVDKYIVDFHTSAPYGPLLHVLTPPYTGIVSPAAVEKLGDGFGRAPVGTGPFKFVEWRTNERIVLEANQDYWGGAPALDTVVFRTVPEEGARMLALRSGETDMVLLPAPDQLAALEANPGYAVSGTPGIGVFALNFNLDMPIVDDVRVRRAIAHAIDRELLVDAILEGGGVLAESFIGEPIFGFKSMELEERYPYDPDKARTLLAEAGYVPGSDGVLQDAAGNRLSLKFLASNGRALKDREIAEVIQEFLRQVGIEVTVDLFEWATTSSILRGEELPYHLTTSAFYTASGDADFALHTNFHSAETPPHGWNGSRYANAQVDEYLEAARSSLDQDERQELYHKVQDILAEELPVIPLYGTYEVAAMRSSVKNFRSHPVNYILDLFPVSKE